MRTWSLLLAAVALALVGVDADKAKLPTIHIVDSERKVTVNQSVQHIPLNATQAHLRPPPARVPGEFDIFIGLSVFRDGHRCAKTMFTGFTRATHPDRLYFGVVDQVNPGDLRCIDEFCKMASKQWPDKGPCHYKDHIRIDERTADDSRGPTLARHYQQKLVRDEEFCLQLDGHSIFTNRWDENILAEWTRIDNEMAVLTTYLHHLNNFIGEDGENDPPSGWLPHLCSTMRGGNGLVRNIGASMVSDSSFPLLSALWGAGLSFSKCHAERRVLIDSHTLWMFDGEEFLRASHLWTHGYDMYSPSGLGSVVYHNYSKVPARFEHVKVDAVQKKIELERGVNRFKLIVGKEFKGQVDTFEMDKFAFGKVRSFEQYLNFSGVTFEEGKNDTDSCRQLHWVPYSNPGEVEAIVGGGWAMNPTKKPVSLGFRDHEMNAKIEKVGVPEESTEKNEKVGVPEENIRKNTELSASVTLSPEVPPGGGFAFVVVLVVVVMIVVFSNNNFSRLARRYLHMKPPMTAH